MCTTTLYNLTLFTHEMKQSFNTNILHQIFYLFEFTTQEHKYKK